MQKCPKGTPTRVLSERFIGVWDRECKHLQGCWGDCWHSRVSGRQHCPQVDEWARDLPDCDCPCVCVGDMRQRANIEREVHADHTEEIETEQVR